LAGYVVVICRRCRKPFIKRAEWKRVRCPYCGEQNSTEGLVVYSSLAKAREAMMRALGFSV